MTSPTTQRWSQVVQSSLCYFQESLYCVWVFHILLRLITWGHFWLLLWGYLIWSKKNHLPPVYLEQIWQWPPDPPQGRLRRVLKVDMGYDICTWDHIGISRLILGPDLGHFLWSLYASGFLNERQQCWLLGCLEENYCPKCFINDAVLEMPALLPPPLTAYRF